MLDSSPVLPAARRPLKRSASTASLASLPTPPRTHRKHTRGRSRGSCDSDSDDHALLSTDDEAPDAPRKPKKRRTGPVAADEDAFWLTSAATAEAATAGSSQAASTNTTSAPTGKSHPAPLLYRRMLAQQQQQQQQPEVAPVSPPPSHRRPAPVASPKRESTSDTAPSPPTTPRTRSATKRAALLRDSPSNPFLATPQKATVADSASPSPIASSATPSPHTPAHHEKPTLTYVFRGVRRTYQNPLYNHAADRPLSPPPASLLPIDHPEYSPPIHCTPKLLFPTAHRKKKAVSRARSPSLSGDERSGEDEREAAGIRPQKLDFGQAENKDDKKKDGKKVKAQRVQTLDKELKAAGDDVFL